MEYTLGIFCQMNQAIDKPLPLIITIRYDETDVLTANWNIKFWSEIFQKDLRSQRLFSQPDIIKIFNSLVTKALGDIHNVYVKSDFIKEMGFDFSMQLQRNKEFYLLGCRNFPMEFVDQCIEWADWDGMFITLIN